MATLILSAVGAAAGSAIGGSFLGLSSAVIGRAVGATIGRVIDQKLLGTGSAPVETGKVDQFRLTGASEGAPVGQVFGRVRLGGQVIWSSRFLESTDTTDAGKGAPEITEYSYSVSLAVALCEGEITRVGRIWADGLEIGRGDLNMTVYHGTTDQMPDPRMEAIEGAGNVPAYRGTAYVVIEDLKLGKFGNRVPQFSFEVMRDAQGQSANSTPMSDVIQAVALIPGTGEYALSTVPEHYGAGPGVNQSANVNSPSGQPDIVNSLDQLSAELPHCGSVLLVSSWFGNDLRCGLCELRPKVEQKQFVGQVNPWVVSGETRLSALQVPQVDGRAIYGGTPNDQSVIAAIQHIKALGKEVVFYPFILMDQLADNTLTNPWTGDVGQPALPWRGRITTSLAPGEENTPDQTQAAADEVDQFFGQAAATDFQANATGVVYSGPPEWSYRRFILHYAHICAAAGGVDAFCIGSEMRGLTQIRSSATQFPAVDQLIALAADVRAILGPGTKLTYAADWSEYFGYHPQDGSGDVLFHLDPLWADTNIDFVGIDNYMPLSDWRDGFEHLDAASADTAHDLSYLMGNIEGGEGYDWYYPSDNARDLQHRSPITDGAHGEDWVFRYKDLRGWWQNPHFNRPAGQRAASPTAWVPQSKPIWFTEYGCAAIDKGTNQPNKFLDPKSSESNLPHFSSGARDDSIQQQYYRAVNTYWSQPGNNPTSPVYGGPMLDMSHAHAWAWDARPYPFFPANADLWSDGDNYSRGHWLNGRVTAQPLAGVVEEVCSRSGVTAADVDALHGTVLGYFVDDINGARAVLQPPMLAYGFDAVERDGKVIFSNRNGRLKSEIDTGHLAVFDDQAGEIELIRVPDAETAGRVRLTHVEADGDFQARSAEAIFPDEECRLLATSDLPLVLTQADGRRIVDRWLAEARVGRDRAKFAMPLSDLQIGAGDVVKLPPGSGGGLYRIDRVSQGDTREADAVRIEPGLYEPADFPDSPARLKAFVPPVPVFAQFMDLPLLTGNEVAHAPHIAVTATPWPGSVSVLSAVSDSGYTLNTSVARASLIGISETSLFRAAPSRWQRGATMRVRFYGAGGLAPASEQDVLNGANALAIGDGTSGNWEVVQFADAVLVAPDTYDISMLLRGQAGTDALIPDVWPLGSSVVALNGTPQQIALAMSERGLARHYRIGPAGRPFDDPSYQYRVEAFDGIGLRPYAPAHLRAEGVLGADVDFSWIRRTRIDGDSWQSLDVPLGEAAEAYLLRVRDNVGAVLREVTLAAPAWTYTAAMQSSDGVAVPFSVEVAQISDRFGAGLFKRIDING